VDALFVFAAALLPVVEGDRVHGMVTRDDVERELVLSPGLGF
jgi:CBS domain-containing protein